MENDGTPRTFINGMPSHNGMGKRNPQGEQLQQKSKRRCGDRSNTNINIFERDTYDSSEAIRSEEISAVKIFTALGQNLLSAPASDGIVLHEKYTNSIIYKRQAFETPWHRGSVQQNYTMNCANIRSAKRRFIAL